MSVFDYLFDGFAPDRLPHFDLEVADERNGGRVVVRGLVFRTGLAESQVGQAGVGGVDRLHSG